MDYSVEHSVEQGIERIVYRSHTPRFETPLVFQHGMELPAGNSGRHVLLNMARPALLIACRAMASLPSSGQLNSVC